MEPDAAEQVIETMRCPCLRADEDADAAATGEPSGHWLMVTREVRIDYKLRPFGTPFLPSHEEFDALLVALEPGVEDEALERNGPGLWTVTCEHRCEDYEAVQALWLRDAVEMWLSRWNYA